MPLRIDRDASAFSATDPPKTNVSLMHEPEIICPICKHPIKLTEFLLRRSCGNASSSTMPSCLIKELGYSKKADDFANARDLAEAGMC